MLKFRFVSKRRQFIHVLMLAFSIGVFVADAQAEWDDDIVKFVDHDVPVLTKTYAEKELKKRWIDAFLAPVIQAGGLQTEIVRRVEVLKFPEVSAKLKVSEAVEILKAIDFSLAALHFDQSRLANTIAQLKSLEDACEKPSVFANEVIQSVGSLALSNVSLPDRPGFYVVYFGDPYAVSTIISATYSIIQWAQDKDRRERAQSAMDRLPARIVSSQWVSDRSQQLCRETRADRANSLGALRKNLVSFAEQLYAYESRLWKTYRRIEYVLREAAFTDVLERSGSWSAEVTRSQNLASSQILVDLELSLNEINGLEQTASSANGCLLGISSVETYEDALIELKSQVAALLLQPQLPRVSARLAEVQILLDKTFPSLALQYVAARNRGCNK